MFENCYQRMNEKIKPDTQLIEKTIGLAHQTRRRSKLVPVVVLVVFIVMLSVTALAAKVITGEWFGFLIHIDSPVDLHELLSEPGESIVCGDYRITLQSAVGDGTAYYVLLDVDTVSGAALYDYPLSPISDTLPSNISLNYSIHAQMDHFWNRIWGYNFGGGMTDYRVDDGSDPRRASIIIAANFQYTGRAPKWIEFNITSVSGITQSSDALDQQKIADGSWKFVIAGQTNTKAVTHKINNCVVRITPLSLSLKASSAPFDLDPKEGIQLELVDGTIINIPHVGLSYGSNGLSSDWQMTALFDRTIDPLNVSAILIADNRIELK